MGMILSLPCSFIMLQRELSLQQLVLLFWLDSWLYNKILKCCIIINKVFNMHFSIHRHHHRPSRWYILPKCWGKSFQIGNKDWLSSHHLKGLTFICALGEIPDLADHPIHSYAFDSDSSIINVDNCSSRTMTNCLQDMVGPLKKVNYKVLDHQGKYSTASYEGTIRWRWDDDNGRLHTHYIPKSLYVENSQGWLLSPQHWAQMAKDHHPKPHGTGTFQDDEKMVLYWGQRKFKKDNILGP